MIDIRFLGTISVQGGRDCESLLGRPRDVALLAYLVVARPSGFHTREALLALLWPESDDARGRNALNQALHRLRRTLGDSLMSRGAAEVGLDHARTGSDVMRFRDARAGNRFDAALEEYRGDLLAGFHVSQAPAFDHWLETERRLLRMAAQDAARTLRNDAADAGELDMAIHRAHRAMELSREEVDVLALAELQARAGDRLSALRTCSEFESWMRTELELEPTETFQAKTYELRTESAGQRPSVIPGGETSHVSGRTPATNPRRKRLVWVCLAILVLGASAFWGTAGFVGLTPRGPRIATSDPFALEFYERGREYWRLGFDADRRTNWTLAVEMFDSAVSRDPDFAAAHGELAMAHSRLFHFGFDRSAARQASAENAIGRALTLDPDLPEGRLARGYYHLWSTRDYERALSAGLLTLESQPENPDALSLVLAANRRLGKIADAIEPMRKLRDLQPRTYVWRWELASTRIGLRQYREARSELDRAVALFPAEPRFYWLLWYLALLENGDIELAATELAKGSERLPADALWGLEFGLEWLSRDYDGALAVLERVRPSAMGTQQGDIPIELAYGLVHRLAGRVGEAQRFYRAALPTLQNRITVRPNEMWFYKWLAIGLAGVGDSAGAVRAARQSEELAEEEPDLWENPYLKQELVEVYVMTGDYDAAVSMLEELSNSHYYYAMSPAWLRLDPRFDPLRSNPRFQQIIAEK